MRLPGCRTTQIERHLSPIQAPGSVRAGATAEFGEALEEGVARMNNQEHRMKPAGFVRLWAALTMPCVVLCAAELTSETASTNRPGSAGGATNGTLQAALQKLKFPGVAINVQERCADVESAVCLHRVNADPKTR